MFFSVGYIAYIGLHFFLLLSNIFGNLEKNIFWKMEQLLFFHFKFIHKIIGNQNSKSLKKIQAKKLINGRFESKTDPIQWKFWKAIKSETNWAVQSLILVRTFFDSFFRNFTGTLDIRIEIW